MRFFSLFTPTAARWVSVVLGLHVLRTQGVNFTPVPPRDLDLSALGRVALTGDFDTISLYTYVEQTQNAPSTNGSQALLTRLPNGGFATLASADQSITTMCSFVRKDGTLAGVVVGGTFTSLDGIQAQGIALFDPGSNKITPLPGLEGKVSALFCDKDSDTVYVGGSFKGANSTNALIWIGMTGWANLPFAGFNGPVNSITKAPGGSVVFGGSFSGLGNTTKPTIKDQQVINLSTANISSGGSSSINGFGDPYGIVCKTDGQDGAGNTWLLQDETPGFWKASMDFGYEPTKLRIWNTHQDGRGTKTFRFTAFPINGIMNLTYTDPNTGKNATCDARCPLSNDPSIKFQDFAFVNVIGMNSFQVDISDWYGRGGGLNGVELFQDDIYAYAVPQLNEPACIRTQFGSNATSTGPWAVTPSGQTVSQYLTADLTGSTVNADSVSVVFKPDIKQSGNYTVTIYTPGCQQDSTCSSRGVANVSGVFAAGNQANTSSQATIYQTNDFDKYDQIYHGYVDANTDSFRPTITLTALANQQNIHIKLVAQRVRFELLDASSSGLNGLFEFDPNQAVVSNDFSVSKINTAGTKLDPGALVTSLAVISTTTYVAGNFSTQDYKNIFAMRNGNASSLPNRGLNAAVLSTFVYGDILFVGGNFSDTVNPSTPGLSNVASFDTVKQVWHSLGNGVNGRVDSIVPLLLNITAGEPETCVTVNGAFDQILASGSSKAFVASSGSAIWVPSHNDWLQNLNSQSMAIRGQLSAATNISGSSPLLAGTMSLAGNSVSDAVELSSSGYISLNPVGIHITPQPVSTGSKHKRAVTGQNVSGAVTGIFDTGSGRNNTIIAGHFTATASNGSTINNLAIVTTLSSGDQNITGITNGLDTDSAFLALAVQGDTLYAGGTISGSANGAKVNGLVLWNLAQANYASAQPPPFAGSNVAVNTISSRPSSSEVYVGGSFDAVGSLSCPSLCVYQGGTWSRPGTGLSGSIASLTWQGNDKLLVGGNLTIGGNATTLAFYDATKQLWTSVDGTTNIPGPVTALSAANNGASQFWVAGKSLNGSAFLMKYDGSNSQSVGDTLGKQTTIRGLSVLAVSTCHDDTSLVDSCYVLLITGQLNLPGFGNASAALFNGTTFSPFILSNSGSGPGSLSQLFTEKQQPFAATGGRMKLAYVILIALAIALGLIGLMILVGRLLQERARRKEGYRPMAQNYFEKTSNMSRIPPEDLFAPLNHGGNVPGGGPRL